MRKSIFIVAAIAALGVTLPVTAPAEAATVVVHRGYGWHPHRPLYNAVVPAGGAVVTHRSVWHPAARARVVVRDHRW